MGSEAMNHVERFRAAVNFEPVDRLPCWEWAMWWDQTIERWHGEGLPRTPPEVSPDQYRHYLRLLREYSEL